MEPAGVFEPADVSLLVVSPHLDDAALSCGALLASVGDAGGTACVVSVFTASPILPLSDAAARWHARCGLGDDAMYARAREDRRACALLGAIPVHLGFREALYRHAAGGAGPRYANDGDIFGAIADADVGLAASLADAFAQLPEWADADIVLAPLGVGGHVDHVVTSNAVCELPPPGRLLFYEEVPYVLYGRCAGWESALPAGRESIAIAAQPRHWERKLAAICCYASQLDALWERPERWRRDIATHARRACRGQLGERYWG